MSDISWYEGIESTVFTAVSHKVAKNLELTEEEDFFCTTEDNNHHLAHFPTWYLHEIESSERYGELSGDSVVSVLYSMELQIFSDISRTECERIMHESVKWMKRLFKFQLNAMPLYESSDGLYRGIARFRRLIAAGDIDIVSSSENDSDED